MNWSDNLSLIGAVRLGGCVTLGTQWKAVTAKDFVAWVRDRLAPRLQPGDIVVLDNLRVHKAAAVADLIARRGATLKFLPPYSHDFNPIEAAWGLIKKYIRTFAPRAGATLRRVARAARHVVDADHCYQFFAHAGYVTSSA